MRLSEPLPAGQLLAARSTDGIVYLDIAGDAYLCRYAPLPAAWADGDDALPLPHGKALPTVSSELRLASCLSFLRALLCAAIDFHRLDFAALLASATKLPSRPATIDPDRYARAVVDFERLCLLLPFPCLCLFRSYLLLWFLALQGLSASWVFGVSLFPFEAHCWVACEDFLLAERAERVAGFSIIHSVGPATP